MSEPPGVSSALGIESVEWVAEGGENLTVRVTGRWRRRRPAWSAQPTLVIEGPGRRYRFPAIAEPPSLTGTGPGMWRITFAVPAALAPELGGRAWLQFGAVVVPLPAAVRPEPAVLEPEAPGGGGEIGFGPPGPDPGQPDSTREVQGPAAGHPLTARVAELERELGAARQELERLGAELRDTRLARRAAEQGARAERTLRQELARRLARRSTETADARRALDGLESVQERIRSLQREVERFRPPAALPEHPAERRRRGLEQELRQHRLASGSRIPNEPPAPSVPGEPVSQLGPAPAGAPQWAAPSPGATGASEAELAALHDELRQRAYAEASLQSRLVDTEARLAARDELAKRIGVVLAHLKQELEGLREEVASSQEARQQAEQRVQELESELGGVRTRSQSAYHAIAELRGSLDTLRRAEALAEAAAAARPAPPEGDVPAAESLATPGLEFEPSRLNEALVRLREQIAPADDAAAAAEDVPPPTAQAPAPAEDVPARPAPPPPAPGAPAPLTIGRAWLRPAFRSLARRDPVRGGWLLLDLLPAQRAVHPQPVAYDLVLADAGTVSVTVRSGGIDIRAGGSPRPAPEIDFSLHGDLASVARLLAARRLRRLFRRGLARVRGRRDGLAALDALLDTELSLAALSRAGARLRPAAVLGLVSELVPAEWVREEAFTLGYRSDEGESAYLITGPQGLRVTDSRPTRITTTITGPAGTLEEFLAGRAPLGARLEGDERALVVLRRLMDRAQSG